MPSNLTPRGRRALTGRRGVRSTRKLDRMRPVTAPVIVPIVDEYGNQLNIPETLIYRALNILKVPFRTQVNLGGANQVGSAKPDFVLDQHLLILGYDGPFHGGQEGATRDFWRKVNYEQFGYDSVSLYLVDVTDRYGNYDQRRTIDRVQEVIGNPAIATAMSFGGK